MKTKDLFHACNVADAEEMADELDRALNHLMNHYHRNPIGYEGEEDEMKKAHSVLIWAAGYFEAMAPVEV